MSFMFKRKKVSLSRRLTGVGETEVESLLFDNQVAVQALYAILDACDDRTVNKNYIKRIAKEALRQIGQ